MYEQCVVQPIAAVPQTKIYKLFQITDAAYAASSMTK